MIRHVNMTSRIGIFWMLSVMLCLLSDIDDTSAHRDKPEVEGDDESSSKTMGYVKSTPSTQNSPISTSTITKITPVSAISTTTSTFVTVKTTTPIKPTTMVYTTLSQASVSVRKSGRATVFGTFSQTPVVPGEQADVLNVTPSGVIGIGHNTIETVIIIGIVTLVCLLIIILTVVVYLRRKRAPSGSNTLQKTQLRDVVNPVYRMDTKSGGTPKYNQGPYLEPRPTAPSQQGGPGNVYQEIDEDVESQKSVRNSESNSPATHDYLELLPN